MLSINPSRLPELKPRHLDERDLRKRAKLLKECKRAMWKRWKLGIVSDLMKAKDDVVRGAKVRTANGELERAIQRRYLLELSIEEKNWEPNPSAPAFIPRPRRDAAVAAELRVQQHAQTDGDVG